MVETISNKVIPHRRTIRYDGYDYSSAGVYFVTLVTFHHRHLFGQIENGIMKLNELGKIVHEEWFKTAQLRPTVELDEDEFVIMPNHIHGIIWITGQDSRKQPLSPAQDSSENIHCTGDLQDRKHPISETAKIVCGTGDLQVARTSSVNHPRPKGPISNSVGAIIAGFKAASTKKINIARGTFRQPIWLRNYYEHIIETEKEYYNIANYIHDNPMNWGSKDEYYS